jgi:hypothetical protein
MKFQNETLAAETFIVFRIAKNCRKTYNYYLNNNSSIDLNPDHSRMLSQFCIRRR